MENGYDLQPFISYHVDQIIILLDDVRNLPFSKATQFFGHGIE